MTNTTNTPVTPATTSETVHGYSESTVYTWWVYWDSNKGENRKVMSDTRYASFSCFVSYVVSKN